MTSIPITGPSRLDPLRRAWVAIVLIALTARAAAATLSIVDSPHNLSSSGPGPVHALDEDRVCIFCHTPHNARTNAPLWNRNDSAAAYTPYDSPTLRARPGQPTGTSKLCLSCHDGTVALGDLVASDTTVTMAGSSTMPAGHGLIGTDLRNDHPISFSYAESLAGSDGQIAPPNAWDPAVKLDAGGMLQCTTCHDPHDNQWGAFLVMPNDEATLCRQCHTMADFAATGHATSPATWSGVGRDPWPHTEFPDVVTNACMNCHQSHHAPGSQELLTADRPEQVCLTCHDGTVAQTDVQASLRKPYRHPIAETGAAHRPGESPLESAGHVTCVDCHNPHRATAADADAPQVPGVLEGVSGLSAAGTPVDEAQYEYEVCFKCHADDAGRRSFSGIARQVASTRLIDQFSAASPSSHPVVVAATAGEVPSLIPPMDETTMIGCGDCHGDDDAGTAGGRTPAGSHGSRFRFLLKRDYQTGDTVGESAAAYALCYGCHDRQSILANESFAGHRQHIVDQQTPCSACHNAHGIDPAAGNAMNNAGLMDFDRAVVDAHPAAGGPEYVAAPGAQGTCTLRCHGKDHDGATY